MPEWTDAGPYPAVGGFRPARLTGINVIPSAYRQRHAISRRHDNAGRPHLDIDLVDVSRLEELDLVMGMIGPVKVRLPLVELAQRDGRPGLRHGRVRSQCSPEHYFLEARSENPNDEKPVGSRGRGRCPQ